MEGFSDNLIPSKTRGRLVVLLHGLMVGPESMRQVVKVIQDARPDADIYLPTLPYAIWHSTVPLADITSEVMKGIARTCAGRAAWGAENSSGAEYDEVILFGYSLGAVVARKAFIAAWGYAPDVAAADGDPSRVQPWARRVRTVIFLAGMNRGWLLNSALGYWESLLWRLGSFIGNVFLRGRATPFDIRRGAPFLVETRLQWLALTRRDQDRPDVAVVQMLGTIDDLVSPDDCIDFTIDMAGDQAFFLVEIPHTGHVDALQMKTPNGPGDGSVEAVRGEVLRSVLLFDRENLGKVAIKREYLADVLPPKPEPDVDNVVFVIHGIRDHGFWTQKIARKVRERAAAAGKSFRAVTATYGYFPMLPFVLPGKRREKVQWLMDQYTEARARYPRAEFSYVGHSNGTYLLARSLRDYPSARFKHVVFAGSVVRCDYDWASLLPAAPDGRGRVEKVLNYIASGDWVVALFPKGLEPIKPIDLGAAGHDGFIQADRHTDRIHQIRYIKGSHSAGIKESQWHEIAEFIVNGAPPSDDALRADHDLAATQDPKWRLAGRVAPGLLGFIIALIVGFALLLALAIPIGKPGALAATALVMVLLAYIWLLRTILLRV